MTLQSMIGGALRSVMPALYPLGSLQTVVRTEQPNGDVTTEETTLPVRVQREPATERMRASAGYTDRDVALIVLGQVPITTDDTVTDAEGGTWRIGSVEYDAALSHWICRGTPL